VTVVSAHIFVLVTPQSEKLEMSPKLFASSPLRNIRKHS
jgi:hypothetical protein